MPKPYLLLFFAVGHASACVHTGHLPGGPPPEYEETPLPKGMTISTPAPSSTQAPAPALAPLPAPPSPPLPAPASH